MFVESWTSFVWARQRPPNVQRGLWGGEGMIAVQGGFPRASLAGRLDFFVVSCTGWHLPCCLQGCW